MKHHAWRYFLQSILAVIVLTVGWACSREPSVAKLESKQGEVQRNQAKKGKAWAVADIGVTFTVGDALRTAHAATAIVALEGTGKLSVRQDTVVRFQNRRPLAKRHDFDVETGQVMLEAGSNELLLATSIGMARIEANGQVLIRRTPEGLQFDVTVGKARFEAADDSRTVEAGQSYVVNVGNAVVEKNDRLDAGRSLTAAAQLPDAAVAPSNDSGVSARVTGNGASQKGPTDRTFQSIPPGATRIRPGVTLRIETGSNVELEHGRAKASLSGAGSYKVKADGDSLVEVQSGKLSVSGPTRILVPGGMIETNDNAVAALETLGKGRTRVRVAQGAATLVGGQTSTKVSAGEEATLSTDGSTKLEGRGLSYADFTANAGESLIVHDPKPPTAVRFMFASRCTAGGTIRVHSKSGGQFASGVDSAALAFGPGRQDYALYCLNEHGAEAAPVARGTLTVLRDAGTRPVPTTPPSTTVNLDGHNYTVMYQNQLPSLTVVWPNAPPASSFTLNVESSKGAKRYSTSTPKYSFKSGALPEGHHTIYFEGGSKISRHTGVQIAFDNAAPMASLVIPTSPDTDTTGDITIAGVALPGWQVDINGDKISQDGQQRFSQRVQAPTSDRAVAVKLTHPTRGVHVYLRRTARAHE
jgi:hypothetical protein